ncbi:MAG TPA: hypothetical protein PLN38_15100 [Chitinophagales bacterium]|nr:hypothetical protein [Chitinophagales bacterium]
MIFTDNKKYTETTLDTFSYDQPQIIETSTPDSPCIDLLFYNEGAETAYINSFPLATGASIRWDCNQGEVLVVKVNLTFSTGAGTKKCYMTRRRIKKSGL